MLVYQDFLATRIRIRIRPNKVDPGGSGSISGSETLHDTMQCCWVVFGTFEDDEIKYSEWSDQWKRIELFKHRRLELKYKDWFVDITLCKFWIKESYGCMFYRFFLPSLPLLYISFPKYVSCDVIYSNYSFKYGTLCTLEMFQNFI